MCTENAVCIPQSILRTLKTNHQRCIQVQVTTQKWQHTAFWKYTNFPFQWNTVLFTSNMHRHTSMQMRQIHMSMLKLSLHIHYQPAIPLKLAHLTSACPEQFLRRKYQTNHLPSIVPVPWQGLLRNTTKIQWDNSRCKGVPAWYRLVIITIQL